MMYDVSSTTPSLNGSSAKKKSRGRDHDCFTASPKEERLKIQVGFWWQLNCCVFKTFSLSHWQLCRNWPSFRCYSPKPACEFAVARSCSIHHVLSTTHCIITGNWKCRICHLFKGYYLICTCWLNTQQHQREYCSTDCWGTLYNIVVTSSGK